MRGPCYTVKLWQKALLIIYRGIFYKEKDQLRMAILIDDFQSHPVKVGVRSQTLEQLEDNISREIRTTDGMMLALITGNKKRRVKMCLAENDGLFQYLMRYARVLQKPRSEFNTELSYYVVYHDKRGDGGGADDDGDDDDADDGCVIFYITTLATAEVISASPVCRNFARAIPTPPTRLVVVVVVVVVDGGVIVTMLFTAMAVIMIAVAID
ncbi:hypothetical protein ANN_11568 [Periplaneta americana]|uniref:Uncharacterized protein n=1 Tax=Periplaneta americana TaxID=6978 RepID=A0ABQ8T744_PERAM|nr:hypothetical protein ANN_11568 [Periplaneta americana]